MPTGDFQIDTIPGTFGGRMVTSNPILSHIDRPLIFGSNAIDNSMSWTPTVTATCTGPFITTGGTSLPNHTWGDTLPPHTTYLPPIPPIRPIGPILPDSNVFLEALIKLEVEKRLKEQGEEMQKLFVKPVEREAPVERNLKDI